MTEPIIFGDYIKMGAEKHDRLYEELNDLKKLKNVLQDVSLIYENITKNYLIRSY